MIRFFKLAEGKLGISVSGSNVRDLYEAIQNCGYFKFHKFYDSYRNIYVGDKYGGIVVIPLLCGLEDIPVSRDLIEYCNDIKPETEFVRRAYIPELFKGNPLGGYQLRSIKKGICQNRYMLAHQMRLGKSISINIILNHLIHYKLIDSILYVSPPESIYNFRRELLKWNTYGLTDDDIYIADVNNRDPFDSGKKVILISYRTFLMLSDDAYLKKYPKKKRGEVKNYRKPVLSINNWGKNRIIILDESQRIARLNARWTKMLHLHKDYFDYRYLLSGSPEPNKKIEGWYSQVTFLDSKIIPAKYYGWLGTVAKLGDRFSKYSVSEYYPDKIAKFIDSIKPWVSREFQKDNLDLPELVPVKNYLRLNDKQLKIYKELAKHTLKEIKRKYGRIDGFRFKTQLPHFMLALDNPCLLKNTVKNNPVLEKLINSWKFKDHSKIEAVTSLLQSYIEEESRKVILWSGHPHTVDNLAQIYKKYNPVAIHGSQEVPKNLTKQQYRDQRLEEFKKSKDSTLLIASYLVLYTSVSITEATRSIYFDRGWNAEPFAQSQQRTQGPLQKEKVLMNLLIFENTFDERLDQSLDGKENMDKLLFKRDSLSMEEWEKLFLPIEQSKNL